MACEIVVLFPVRNYFQIIIKSLILLLTLQVLNAYQELTQEGAGPDIWKQYLQMLVKVCNLVMVASSC